MFFEALETLAYQASWEWAKVSAMSAFHLLCLCVCLKAISVMVASPDPIQHALKLCSYDFPVYCTYNAHVHSRPSRLFMELVVWPRLLDILEPHFQIETQPALHMASLVGLNLVCCNGFGTYAY